MRRHPRRTSVNPGYPEAWGTSDRNGMIGTRAKMQFQRDWRGNKIINTRVLVHPDELDKPQRQLGSLTLPPDPPPIKYPKPENYSIDEQVFDISAAYSAVAGDILSCTGTFPVTLPTSIPVSGQSVSVNNDGTGVITLNTVLGQLIRQPPLSYASGIYTIGAGLSATFLSDGPYWRIWP